MQEGFIEVEDVDRARPLFRAYKMQELLIVDRIPTEPEEVKSSGQLVAVRPETCAVLDRWGLDYLPLDAFIDEKSLAKKGLDQFDTVWKLAGVFDQAIASSLPEAHEYGLKIARYQFYRFLIMMNTAYYYLLCLTTLRDRLSADHTVLLTDSVKDLIDEDLFFVRESLVEKLSPLVFRQVAIVNKGRYPEVFPEDRKKKLSVLRRLASLMKKEFYSLDRSRKRILFLDFGYDLPMLRDLFPHSIFYFREHLPLDEDNEPTGTMSTADIEAIIEQVRPLFVFDRIDISEVLKPRLIYFLQTVVPQAIRRYRGIRDFVSRKRIDAVFAATSVSYNSLQGATAQAVRDAGAAFNVYQHGSLGIWKIQARWITECELIPRSNYFLWGSEVKADFQEAADKAKVNLLLTGSFQLKGMARQARTAKRIIRLLMYTPTTYRRQAMYYPGGINHTDLNFYRVRKAILETITAFSGFDFLVKLHPAEKELTDLEILAGPGSRIAFSRARLSDVIDKADGYIIDYPSTTLLQVLMTGKPVFVYLGGELLQLNKNVLEMLEDSRVSCCVEPELVAQRLTEFLENPCPTVPAKLALFFKAFGDPEVNERLIRESAFRR